MTLPTASVNRSSVVRSALVAFCTVLLTPAGLPSLKAADGPTPQALADKAAALPFSASFEKVSGTEDGPYVLHLKNESKDSIKASAKVYPSVSFHANAKERDVPEHVVDSGQVWSISGLAASDKVTVMADGYAPLELTVP
jgi:hypothetical protein